MSAVPQGAFASLKIKQNLMRMREIEFNDASHKQEVKYPNHFLSNDASAGEPPLKYSNKLMNSIWGLYNRYSVHNFKKNTASGTFAVFNDQRL